MKKVLVAIISIIMLVSFPYNNVFAKNDVITDKMFMGKADEREIVLNYINHALSEIQSATDVAVARVSNSQMSDVIRVYQVRNDIFELYEKWKTVDSILNGKYVWEIPVYNEEGKVVTDRKSVV